MPGQTSEGHMSGITKSMLIERIATRYPALPPKDVELAIKAIFDRMSRQLVEGGRIELRGFGSFSLHKRKARVGRNPKPLTHRSLDYDPHALYACVRKRIQIPVTQFDHLQPIVGSCDRKLPSQLIPHL
jgi:nucleoid DNA-binding protein